MNYVFTALLLTVPFLSFCHHAMPNWWNTPHQSLIGMNPLISASSNFKAPDLTKLQESHHGIVLRDGGTRYVITLHIKPKGETPEIRGLIFPSGKADQLNFFTGELEKGKDRTWIRFETKPAQSIWGTRHSYTTKLELKTRLSFLESADGTIYIHPTTEKSTVYTTEPSKVLKAAQGRWLSTDADTRWELNLNQIEGDYLKGTLTSKSGQGTCEYQAIATSAVALDRYLIFTTDDQSGKADCPAHSWEAVLPKENGPSKFESINSVSPDLNFSRR